LALPSFFFLFFLYFIFLFFTSLLFFSFFFPFILSFFFLFSFFSFSLMEALPSLTLGPPLGFHSSLASQMMSDPSSISSAFIDKGVIFQNVPCFNYGALFSQHGMA